ncbi:MAG: TIM-barrel domain-containing protein [Bacteroidia bacterium]
MLGNLKDYKFLGETVELIATNGFVNITPYTQNIIRIHFSKQPIKDDFSYSVIEKPQKVNASLDPMAQLFFLRTDSIDVTIQTNPLRFSCTTKDNRIIINDDLGLGISWIGDEITAYKKINTDEKFIGLGEKTGHLNRKGEGYTNWNTDAYSYSDFADPIYASIPFYIGIHDSLCYGIFLDNTAKSFFNFGAANNRFSSFTVESGDMNYYIIYGANVAEIIKSYTWLTGRMPLPPKWSLGFQQCRYGYYPESKLMEVARKLREQKIPCDMLYLDIDYMDRYRVFTWDSIRFPNPKRMLNELKSLGFHTTTIINPGIGIANNYSIYNEAKAKNYFLKYPDGEAYSGEVWPGWCNFPDFTKPEARTWWGTKFSGLVNDGIDGFWNDMNEPAMWGKHIPNSVEFDYDGRKATSLAAHNVYGMQMTRATFDGVTKLMNGKRPFILTRAVYAGTQRYSSIWTGDNNPTDDHMLTGVRLVNSLGLSGMPFAGTDISGFTGTSTAELYTRWMSIGVFTPLFRSHKSVNASESEPWSYGINTENQVRKYIELRYRLMPYIYNSFYESSVTGIPISRSLVFSDAFNKNVFDHKFENEFMFGDALLIAPCKSTDVFVKVFLPQGVWYDFYDDEQIQGNNITTVETPLNRLPIFVKAGSIIPQQSLKQNTTENPGDTLYIHVYYDEQNPHSITYYEDDGVTNANTKNEFMKRTINYNPASHNIILEASSGNYISDFKIVKLLLHSFKASEDAKPFTINNQTAKSETFSWLINDETSQVITTSFINKTEKISISW